MTEEPRFRYEASGLSIRSELMIPELLRREFDHAADVDIRFARVSKNLPDGARVMPEARVTRDTLLLSIPRVGRFLVRDGSVIEIDPHPRAREEDLRLFLLGSSLGAVYFQRGLFPLHASVVAIDGQAVAFAGIPGAGKSTMAAWMNAHGHPVLCDDVCAVRLNESEPPMAFPAYPRMKLWKDTLGVLDERIDGLQRDYSRADKYHLAVRGPFCRKAMPLRHVFFLQFSEELSGPETRDIPPARAVPLLRDNTFRYQYIGGMGLAEKHFGACVALADRVAMHYLVRPRAHDRLEACRHLIEERCA